MGKNYENGEYAAYAEDGVLVGLIDQGGTIRNGFEPPLYRVDGEEVYEAGSPPGGARYLGDIEDGVARSVSGKFLFTIRLA